MKLVIDRTELLRALGHVTSVVEKRNTIPILSNVLMKTSGSVLTLKATDLEREVVEEVQADVKQPGAITVPAHLLHDIVRKVPEGLEIELTRDVEKERLTLTAGSSRFSLQSLAADDFPDLATGELGHTFTVPTHELRRLIDKTKFAISTEESRLYLNGIYFHTADTKDGPTLRGVATDGHRLALVDIARPKGAEGMPGVIVPRKTVQEVFRLTDGADETITIGISPTKIRFDMGSITLTSKLIDGSFPDYNRVIPQNNDKDLKVANGEFISAVDRVSTIATERGRVVKLSLSTSNLVLSVNNPDGGSATEELGVTYGSSKLDIGFNARYLLDIASQLEGDTAEFKLADPSSPIIVRDNSSGSALYVLMPMRV